MEAVKQGAATLGIKGKNHSVLVALKRASSDLSSHQKKIIPIDDHAGISIAGSSSSSYCRQELSLEALKVLNHGRVINLVDVFS